MDSSNSKISILSKLLLSATALVGLVVLVTLKLTAAEEVSIPTESDVVHNTYDSESSTSTKRNGLRSEPRIDLTKPVTEWQDDPDFLSSSKSSEVFTRDEMDKVLRFGVLSASPIPSQDK